MNYNLEKQHSKGKFHAIERINMLLDKDSFLEIGSGVTHDCHDFEMDTVETPYDGVITGMGLINDRQVGVYAQDFSIMGGSLGYAHGQKIAKLIEKCISARCPVIGINDSGGARIQEGIKSLASYGDIFFQNTRASGYIPQISIIAGPCAGGAVYSPAITDYIFVIDKISKMYVTGPKVVKSVMNETVTDEQLGGASLHAGTSGVAHFKAKSEKECFSEVRNLLSVIPHNNYEGVWTNELAKSQFRNRCNINGLIPESRTKGYEVREIISEIFDKNSLIEVQKLFAQNTVIGFAKLGGITVGVVANQPKILGGVLNSDASDKIARFVRYCDCYRIPIITLVDVPGFLPGTNEEKRGIIRHGAKMLYAYSEATVPKITLVMRKAYGGAYIAMCSKHLGADYVFAWPKAEIAVMGAQGAVDVLYFKALKNSDNPTELRSQKIEEYNNKFLTPDIALKYGYVDELITHNDTRDKLLCCLMTLNKKKSEDIIKKRHGNIPL